LEPATTDEKDVIVTALCLVDGNVLNEDFELYLSIIGERQKRIGLGTYGDGADRARPMLIFSNPLGVREIDGAPTLIHPDKGLTRTTSDLGLAYRLRRSLSSGDSRSFSCYRHRSDLPPSWIVSDLIDPFPTPKRDVKTRPRGRFKLPFRLP
jgi:hypothetical protein